MSFCQAQVQNQVSSELDPPMTLNMGISPVSDLPYTLLPPPSRWGLSTNLSGVASAFSTFLSPTSSWSQNSFTSLTKFYIFILYLVKRIKSCEDLPDRTDLGLM